MGCVRYVWTWALLGNPASSAFWSLSMAKQTSAPFFQFVADVKSRSRLSGKSVRFRRHQASSRWFAGRKQAARKNRFLEFHQADLGRPVVTDKIFRLAFCYSAGLLSASRLKQEGRTRDRHDTRGGDAVDAVASGAFARDDWRNGGRRSRVVLAPQGWR
jgi:hypothetical protein